MTSLLSEYFANRPAQDLVSDLHARIDVYYRYLQTSGKLARWEKSYRYYYGLDNRGMSTVDVRRAGGQGELYTMRVNHYRSLNQSLLTLTTSQQPAYEVRATNTDYRSQTQTIIGAALLDFYVKEKKLGRTLREAAEYSLIFDEGFLYSPWDETLGEEWTADPETGRILRKGDIRYEAKGPLDVVRDPNGRDSSFRWAIVKSWANRYDLAAEHPEHADAILSQAASKTSYEEKSFLLDAKWQRGEAEGTSDLVAVWELWHDQTSAVPDGRYLKFVGDIPLADATLTEVEYDRIPLNRMAGSEQAFTIHGYSSTLDLLAIQEAVDTIYSTILTNQSTFGVQNVWKKKGDGISLQQLPGGLNLIETEEEPKPLNLTSTPAEIFNFLNVLEGVMEKLSGVNSVVRGDPGSNLKSGAALALVASQAMQLMGNLNNAYDQLFEAVGTLTFQLLQRKAHVPRLVAIAGKFNKSYIREFTAKDIEHVARIVVDRGNYLTKMAAGRVELANALLEKGMVGSAQEYLTVIQTGRLEPLTEAPMAELLNIRAENEALKEGRPVKAIRGDKHGLHKEEHLALIASPEARMNPELVAAVLAHVEEHEELEVLEAQRQMDLQARIQAPPPSLQSAAALPSGQAPGQGGGEPASAAAALTQAPDPSAEAQAVRMPTNPLTGERYQPGN